MRTRPSEPRRLTCPCTEFRFYPTGHSVVRADFKYPCIPYEYVELNRKGFYSGIQNVQAILSNVC